LRELIEQRYKGVPVVGDRVVLGGIELVVRETDGKRITQVGLAFHQPAPQGDGK